MDPDLELIQSIAQGNAGALNELMQRHKEALHRFAYRYSGNAADAAELVQEAFVRVWFHADKFRPRAQVRGWLYSILANLCRDHSRKQKRQRGTVSIDAMPAEDGSPLADRLPATTPTAVEETTSTEELQRLRMAVQRLPHRLKAPFILCVLEETSHEAAAQTLGISAKAVETRIYRARNRLRKALGGVIGP